MSRFLLLILLSISLAGCTISHAGPIEVLTGNTKAIDALLSAQDMPAMWHMVTSRKSKESYWCSGESYFRGFAPIFKAHRDDPLQGYVSHIIYVCSDISTARERFNWISQINPNIVGPITHIGLGHIPAHANEYKSYCGNFRDGSAVCMTIARYGNLVSVVAAEKQADMPTFPINMNVTESNLLDWVMVRNDALLSGSAK